LPDRKAPSVDGENGWRQGAPDRFRHPILQLRAAVLGLKA
jgi:hypothetical protein